MDYQSLASIIPKETQNWTTSNVQSWLRFVHLQTLIPKIRQFQIDGSSLRNLQKENIKSMFLISSNIILKKFLAWLDLGFSQFDQYFRQNHPNQQYIIEEQSQCEPLNQLQHVITQTNILTKREGDVNRIIRTSDKRNKNQIILGRVQSTQFERFKFLERNIKIGRNHECDITIEDESVEKYHALIFYKVLQSKYYLKNFSKVGTFIKIQSQYHIQDQSLIQLGANFINFKVNEGFLECQVINGPNKGDKFSILQSAEKWRIGRKIICDIHFQTDQTLSNIHGKVTFLNARWTYEDLETTNGSWYKMEEETRVQNNMIFKLGTGNYVYKSELLQDEEKYERIPEVDQRQMCYKCLKNQKNMVSNPCNHCCLCEQCAKQMDFCFICSKRVEKNIKIFIS